MPDVTITIKTINQSDEGNKRAIGSLTELSSAIGLVREGLDVAQKAYAATVGKTLEYANEVRSLSQISGESAKETSRFIQVLDDYKLTTDDAMAATRAMTKNGLVPNIETLAKLSDQYLSITDAQERNEFVIKNLGKSGLQWVEVLNKGSAAIRAQGAAVSEGLLLNEEMLRQARELEIAQDDWNDTMQEVSLTLGTKALPTLTNLTKYTLEASRATSDEIATWEKLIPPLNAVHTLYISVREALTGEKEATVASTQANAENAVQREKTKEEIKTEQDALRALTQANNDYLSLVGSLTESMADYEKRHDDIQRELSEGNITVQEAQKRWRELADEQDRASHRMILNMLQQQLAADGLTNAETSYLLDLGLKWGIYSQRAVDEARRAQAEVARLTQEFNNVPSYKQIDVVTNYVTTYGYTPAPSTRDPRRRAGGGDVWANQPYLVGERGPEMFVPSQNGTIVPNNQVGTGGIDERAMERAFVRAFRKTGLMN